MDAVAHCGIVETGVLVRGKLQHAESCPLSLAATLRPPCLKILLCRASVILKFKSACFQLRFLLLLILTGNVNSIDINPQNPRARICATNMGNIFSNVGRNGAADLRDSSDRLSATIKGFEKLVPTIVEGFQTGLAGAAAIVRPQLRKMNLTSLTLTHTDWRLDREGFEKARHHRKTTALEDLFSHSHTQVGVAIVVCGIIIAIVIKENHEKTIKVAYEKYAEEGALTRRALSNCTTCVRAPIQSLEDEIDLRAS